MRKFAGFIAMLLVGMSAGITPAQAVKFSARCSDGFGGAEFPVMVTPYTLGAEVEQVGGSTVVRLCFATSPTGYSGSQLTGGQLEITFSPNGNVHMFCMGDSNSTVAAYCWASSFVTPVGSGVGVDIKHITVDTAVTDPVVLLFGTGLRVFSVTDPEVPCVYVQYLHLIPLCGTPL